MRRKCKKGLITSVILPVILLFHIFPGAGCVRVVRGRGEVGVGLTDLPFILITARKSVPDKSVFLALLL